MPDRAGPLDGLSVAGRGVALSPAAPMSRHILRLREAAFDDAGRALGLDLPTTACTAAEAREHAALWLGPDEFLLLHPEDAGEGAENALAAALGAAPFSLVDVSHRQTAFEVTGPKAALVLNAGCPLDLDLSAFPAGACTRTIIAKSEVVLWRRADERFHLEVWRSFAPYVWGFLREACLEGDL